jgi:aminoglycoside phosphotransferase (APT) family kinase protein
MSAGLAAWLRGVEPAGAPELETALARLVGEPVRFEGAQALRAPHVQRLRFSAEHGAGPPRSLVVKRMSLDRSHREQRALRVWLPRAGLGAHAVPLLAVAAARDGSAAWHVYEDLGDATLARLAAEPGALREAHVRSAAELIAALHVRFAAHPLLADCRLAGQDLGAGFFAASLRDALAGLAALRGLPALPRAQAPLVERLLERLGMLAAESDARARDFAALGWPETLQHGDLWLSNVMLAAGERVHLVDWERAGVGPAVYDLSVLLRQLPAAARPGALGAWRACVRPAGWPWPDPALLERVAASCELGRFASCLAWRVLSALEPEGAGGAAPAWLFDDLVEMERWFRERTALLPDGREASAA